MLSCAVVNCPNYQNNTKSAVTFHRFPTNAVIRKQWVIKCGLDVIFDCSRSHVCSDHFAEEDFENDTKVARSGEYLKRCLKETAEPHLNLMKIKEEPRDVNECEQLTFPASYVQISEISNAQEQLDSCDVQNTRTTNEANFNTALAHIGALSATIQVPSSPPDVTMHHAPSSLPASENWPGDFGFDVSFGPQEKNTKGVAWTYSKIKDKLYVGKDAPCPINFSTATVMPDDVVIRAMALYNSPEQVSEIVHRCVNHSMDEIRKGIFEAEHLIRCESNMATYHIDKTTKRHSVIVPFDNPPAGQRFSTYIYKFVCFGSCAGGPNRRPIMVVFTLEKGGQVIGRRKLDLKICACPGRDRKSEEQQHVTENESQVSLKRKECPKFVNLSDTFEFTKSVSYPAAKRPKLSPDKNGLYALTVDDPDCFEFLKQMKKFYEICKIMKNMNPDVKKTLLNYLKKNDDSE